MTKDYKLSKAYMIHSYSGDKKYYGSTTAPTLAKRLCRHRNDYNSWVRLGKPRGGKSQYVTSFILFEEYGFENCLITLLPITTLPTNRDELRAIERKYIEDNICVNKYIPSRTKNEYSNTVSNPKYNPINNPINNKIKKNCPHCDKEYLNTSLYTHVKTCKKRPTESNDCNLIVSQENEP